MINLPQNLTIANHDQFLLNAIITIKKHGAEYIAFNFSNLKFIDTACAVSLLNFIGYLQTQAKEISFYNYDANTKAKKYLRNAGFFEVLGIEVPGREKISTTTDFAYFTEQDQYHHLNQRLTPWIEQSAGLMTHTISVVSTTLQEIFLNVKHHSNIRAGFYCAQHFPSKNEIHISIADYGIGIPVKVRAYTQEKLSDVDAIEQACVQGFSTKSDIRNRGVGLHLLIEQIVEKNGGWVRIQSGNGLLLKNKQNGQVVSKKSASSTFYHGTQVTLCLKTDNLAQFIDEPEDFQW